MTRRDSSTPAAEPALMDALARHAAGGADARIEHVAVTALTGGHSTFPVERLDLRVATPERDGIRASFVRKTCLAAEVRTLQRLAAVPGALAAPELVAAWWSEARPFDPAVSGFVSPFYPGGPLSAADAMPDAVLATLARLHADTGGGAKPDWLWTFDGARFGLLHAYALKALAASARFAATTPDHHGWLRRLERAGRSPALGQASDELPRSLVHGDMHPGNIVLRADGSPVIIDFGHACIAPPMLDLADIVELDSPGWRHYLAAYRDAGGVLDATTGRRAYWWARAAASLLRLPWAAERDRSAPALIERLEEADRMLAGPPDLPHA